MPHAFVARVELDPATPQAERDRLLREQVIPIAKKQPGFVRGMWMRSADGTTGIGIVLPFHLRLGTGLQIEPSGLPGARALRARLVHSRPVDFVWFCGCEFFSRLDDAELRAWLQPPMDWASRDKSA